MIAISQRDLPYIVLTVDSTLQAYRTDKLAGVKGQCPRAERGHHLRPGRLFGGRRDAAERQAAGTAVAGATAARTG